MDLERLDEALAEFAMFEDDGPLDWHEKPVVDAARAYRDLLRNLDSDGQTPVSESKLANGERVWWCETHGEVNVEQWCPGGPVAAALNQFDDVAEMQPCCLASRLLI